MQRSYVLYLQLLLQAVFFVSQSTSQLVPDPSKYSRTNSVYRAVPEDVNCVITRYKDSANVMIDICSSGTIQVDSKLLSALRLQRLLSYRRVICSAQILGSHNSVITSAYGYGASDHLYGSNTPTNFTRLSNQYFSLQDQLIMGIRFLELDFHYFLGDLRAGHCGTFGIDGCNPSRSGIPTEDQQSASKFLQEIADWLRLNMNEFVFIYIDGDEDLVKQNKVSLLVSHITKAFAGIGIYKRSDRPTGTTSWPTTHQLLQSGKNVAFTTRYDYTSDKQGAKYLHFKQDFCRWSEPSLPLTLYPDCKFEKSGIYTSSLFGTIDRVVSSQIRYGEFDEDLNTGVTVDILDDKTLPNAMACGVSSPSPDLITPTRMLSMVWTLPPKKSWKNGIHLGYKLNAKYWQIINIQNLPDNLGAACQRSNDALVWEVAGPVRDWDDAANVCDAIGTAESDKKIFSIPAGAHEHARLKIALGNSGYTNVLFNTDLLNMQLHP